MKKRTAKANVKPKSAAPKARQPQTLGKVGATDTKPGDGRKIYSGAFTPVAGAKAQKEFQVSPEQTFDTSLHPSSEPTAATDIQPSDKYQAPLKTDTEISAQRVQQYLLARFNPIRGLSPRLLSTYLEQFDLGFIRWMALVWNKVRERDDQIASVVQARECAPADFGWEISVEEESDEAQAHKKALEEFYNGMSVTHCLDQNQRGGVSLLIRQMMRAVGDKFAAHEIIWRPEVGSLNAELRYVPLWFFENRTGQLRFLPYELAMQGVPLEPGGWMVHVSDGLFAATAVAYIYKQMGLKTWVNYQEKFGIPFLHGKTTAPYQSDEWNQFFTAIQNFSSDGGILTNASATLEAMTAHSSGTMPHEPFCDRMDRAIARIWRGGDLSSMSRGTGAGQSHGGGGVGSMPQMQNEAALAKADSVRISETCQFYLDRWVIRYRFGDKAVPKAKFTIQPPAQTDAQKEIMVDTFLLQAGVPLAVTDLLERYGRNLPEASDTLAHAPAARQLGAGGEGDGADGSGSDAFGNISPGFRRFRNSAEKIHAQKMAKALAPLRERLLEISKISDVALRRVELENVRRSLPQYVGRVAGNPEVVKALDDALATAVVIGATDGAEATGFRHNRLAGLNGHKVNGAHNS